MDTRVNHRSREQGNRPFNSGMYNAISNHPSLIAICTLRATFFGTNNVTGKWKCWKRRKVQTGCVPGVLGIGNSMNPLSRELLVEHVQRLLLDRLRQPHSSTFLACKFCILLKPLTRFSGHVSIVFYVHN